MTMTAPTVTGVCPVLSAAFDDDGAVDLSGFASLCRYVVDSGVRSLMVFGVATENSKLNDQEKGRDARDSGPRARERAGDDCGDGG